MQIKLKAASIMTAATMGAAVLACLALDPATEVPVHWNIHGEVDGTATPLGALLPLAGLQLLMLAVFACLRFIEPRKANLEKSGKAISATATAIIGFMGLLEAALIAQAFGYDVMSSNAILIATGLLLAVVGNYLPKLRSGFFMGIRTPWTLSSEQVWHKTHRLGSRLFVLGGLAIAILSLVLTSVMALTLMMGIITIMVLVPVTYSWWLWRAEKINKSI
ncbi:SdpI family protein [Kordiimonas gwangyangensis]|uniref:SdpI family protein n=2 Tax=Kordiimonas gwangyangensis TaxID=288022 RepID=UPI000363D84B|nr:SdpI family protein [Kordiimonas gwangyangensis]